MSAPNVSTSSSGSTTLPRCLLILRPSRITISCISAPANGSPCSRNASGPMSRSAFVVMRWSNMKLPLSEPATRRSEGSHARRSASSRISSSGRSRSCAGTHAGTHSQSASKWQSSVSVSRRASPPQVGQVALHEVLALRQRVALARRFQVQAAAAPAAARAGSAPSRSARSTRSGSACPTRAGARSRSRSRDSGWPCARP